MSKYQYFLSKKKILYVDGFIFLKATHNLILVLSLKQSSEEGHSEICDTLANFATTTKNISTVRTTRQKVLDSASQTTLLCLFLWINAFDSFLLCYINCFELTFKDFSFLKPWKKHLKFIFFIFSKQNWHPNWKFLY